MLSSTCIPNTFFLSLTLKNTGEVPEFKNGLRDQATPPLAVSISSADKTLDIGPLVYFRTKLETRNGVWGQKH